MKALTTEQQDMIRGMAKAARARYQDAVEQWELNWRIARGSNNIMPVLAGRVGLIDYMAASLVLDDNAAYEASSACMLSHVSEIASVFQPQPEVLLIELSLAIIRADSGIGCDVAKAIRTVAPADEHVCFERSRALILAALIDLDYEVTRRLATELLEACTARRFGKETTEQARQWAIAATKLADGDFNDCTDALIEINKSHRNRIKRELGRIKRGTPSALSACDLVNFPVDALAVLLRDLQGN
jgi:hypothetical protein